jgi:transposase-like protein
LAKISSAGFRAPAPFNNLNVNFCKNPKCANFGVPETAHRIKRAAGAAAMAGDYTIVAAGKGLPLLKCALCGETLPMRSNQAIQEELDRVMAYLDEPPGPSCRNEDCDMFGVPPTVAAGAYVQFGKSAAGTPRYRCNVCGKTFSGVGKSTKKHRMPHKNREVFALLVSQMALRRMSWVTQLDRKSIYGKIVFLYEQCQAFSANRERQLLVGNVPLPKMYLSTDRQTLSVNWSNRKDRRNIMLQAIATADLTTGYVFGMDLNFDADLDLDDVELEATALKDHAKPQAFRRFARLWLRSDYDKAVEESADRKASKKLAKAAAKAIPRKVDLDQLDEEIQGGYEDAGFREDVEEVVIKNEDEKLPTSGVEVRDQYTVYAHFLMLERLVGHAPTIRCYLDQDSGFRAAFMAAFFPQVQARRADGWFVKVLKESTIDEKDAAVAKAKRRMAGMLAANPGMEKKDVEVLMALEEMGRMSAVGKWDDRWLTHPVPNKSEPDKRVCWLTDIDAPAKSAKRQRDQQLHAARLYLKASLHAVDRFFMQVRRSVRLAERPIATASADRRMWHGYAAYQPKNLAMVLKIYKTAFNYCLKDADGKTPAMKLGLAQAPVELEDIIYYPAE